MRRQDALLLALGLATVAFAIGFVLPLLADQAVAWYLPTERRWVFGAKPPGLTMDFYGRALQAAIAWCVVFVATIAVAKRVPRAAPGALAVVVGWALAVTLLAIAYFGWTLHARVLVPPATPAWYIPR